MTKRGWAFLIPAAVFALLAAGFYAGLGIDPSVLPSPLIDQPAPRFALPPLPGPAPTSLAPPRAIDAGLPAEQRAAAHRLAHPYPQGVKPGSPELPVPYGSTLPMPQLSLPHFTLPSSLPSALPFPIPLPSNLPSIFQQIPGFGAAAPAAQPSGPVPVPKLCLASVAPG